MLTRLRRVDPRTGWLIAVGGAFAVSAVVFSFASGIVHPYYVSFLAPWTAMLVGAGVAEALRPGVRARWFGALAIAGGAVTELVVIGQAGGSVSWATPLVIVICALAVLGLLVIAFPARVRAVVVAVALAALLAAPASWAVDTLGHATSSTFPAGGPASTGGFGGPGGFAGRGGFAARGGFGRFGGIRGRRGGGGLRRGRRARGGRPRRRRLRRQLLDADRGIARTRPPTVAAPSWSRARPAPPRRSSPVRQTWPASVASPAWRVRSARRGWRWRSAPAGCAGSWPTRAAASAAVRRTRRARPGVRAARSGASGAGASSAGASPGSGVAGLFGGSGSAPAGAAPFGSAAGSAVAVSAVAVSAVAGSADGRTGSAKAFAIAEKVGRKVTFTVDGQSVTMYDLQGKASAILAAAR